MAVQDVDWGELDFLIVDAPPGTSDEHISVAQVGVGPSQPSSPASLLPWTIRPCRIVDQLLSREPYLSQGVKVGTDPHSTTRPCPILALPSSGMRIRWGLRAPVDLLAAKRRLSARQLWPGPRGRKTMGAGIQVESHMQYDRLLPDAQSCSCDFVAVAVVALSACEHHDGCFAWQCASPSME